jgi:pilus assembly protein CpaC
MAQKLKSADPMVHVVARALLCLVAMLPMNNPAFAAKPAATAHPVPLVLDVDKAQLIILSEPAITVFVANPDIADVQVPEPTHVLVYAKKAGETTAFALLRSGATIKYAIQVQRPNQTIGGAIREQAPNAGVQVSSMPNGLAVSGSVASPADAQAVKETARQYLSDTDKLALNVGVREPTQVNLQVRVAEVSRQVDKQFGFNWDAVFNDGGFAVGLLTGRAPLATVANAVTGTSSTSFGTFARDSSTAGLSSLGFGGRNSSGTINISSLLDALQSEGLVSVLAQPNLTAVSGETANFLAGGEFPVPVSQALDQITIEWKSFGVSVDFTPTVLDANHISIKVRPEVSELSTQGAVTINNIKIPGVAVRRAETTVELASGQSFAIAGLFLNNMSNEVRNLPGLGDIPVLGALFRSASFQRNESELVIIVTPYIVRPAPRTTDLHLPTDGLIVASDLEQILFGRLTARGKPGGPQHSAIEHPHLAGPAGFMLE